VRVGPTPRNDQLAMSDALTTLVVDIDVCDPAHAPGVGTPVPGGWTSTQLLERVHWYCVTYPVDTLVVTEVNPSRDVNDHTSLLAQHVITWALAGWSLRLSKRDVREKHSKK
jgi:agmatinase